MSQLVFIVAQFIFILWPLFILTALIYSLQIQPLRGRGRRRIRRALGGTGLRMRNNVLITWACLIPFWLVSLFAPGPTPSLIPEPWNTSIFLAGFALLLLSTLASLGWFKSRLRAHIDFHRAERIQDLKMMDPYAFEVLVSETYRAYGYEVQHVGRSGDHGVDVELRNREGQFWIVQCKRYNGSAGESVVRDLYGTLVSERADRGVLVTTAEITPPAREWARGKPIDLVDGLALLKLIEGARERSNGTLFDRLAHFLSHLLLWDGRPSGLQPAPDLVVTGQNGARVYPASNGSAASLNPGDFSPNEATRPIRIHYHAGAPICPNCHIEMVARPQRLGDRPGRALYRCRNYPSCRIVLEGEKIN
jgi:hypothetical protein